MNYYEYIGPPGSGKTTKMSKDFINHNNRVFYFRPYSYIYFFREFFFFFKIYRLKSIKRLIYSIKHLYSIIFANSNLVFDQGLFQIYLTHCSEKNIPLQKDVLDQMLKIIRLIFKEVNFIIVGEKIQLSKVNMRLQKRNNHRKAGLTEVFLSNFKTNIEFLKKNIK